jgi:hypothetical protein
VAATARGDAAAKLFRASPDDLCEVAGLVISFGFGEVVLPNLLVPGGDSGSGRKRAYCTPEEVFPVRALIVMIELAAVCPLLR